MTAMNPATSLGTSGGDCVVEGHNVHLLIVATSSNRKSKASVSWATNSSAGYHKAAWPTNSWLDLEGLNAFQDNGLVQRSGASTTSQLQQVKAPKDGHALTASDTATDERNVVIDARTSLGLDLLADPPRSPHLDVMSRWVNHIQPSAFQPLQAPFPRCTRPHVPHQPVTRPRPRETATMP